MFLVFSSDLFMLNPKPMKHFYTLFFILSSLATYAQTPCDEANAYLVSAYSHVKSSYEANNISHLKYFAHRGLESVKLAKKTLSDCNCSKALEQANKALDVLAKVDEQPTYEDGRYFVKRAKEFSQQSVIEIDKCATSGYHTETVLAQDDLTNLKNEQAALLAQQEALKQKEAEIKKQIAAQKEKEHLLQKQQLIVMYQKMIDLNIKTYNETLKNCHCGHENLNFEPLNNASNNMTISELKVYYNNQLKTLASNYLHQLETCNL